MTARTSQQPLPLATRLIAGFAASLVLLLAVFSASPELHARLHAHEAATNGTTHQLPLTGQDGDGCAVAVFSAGLVLAAVGLLVIARLGRLIDFVTETGLVVGRPNPRHWLPPLCGPPLS